MEIRHAANSPRGSIVNISAIAGFCGTVIIAAYGASRGGAAVDGICGATVRALRHPLQFDPTRHVPTPSGKLGAPDEITWAALYVASDESRFVTGLELVIDGGTTI